MTHDFVEGLHLVLLRVDQGTIMFHKVSQLFSGQSAAHCKLLEGHPVMTTARTESCHIADCSEKHAD